MARRPSSRRSLRPRRRRATVWWSPRARNRCTRSTPAGTCAGASRWRISGSANLRSDPDLVLVGGTGSVTALDRADGSQRWHRGWTSPTNSLAVSGDTALVGDDSGTLAALDAATGAPRWSVAPSRRAVGGRAVDPARRAVVASWHQSASPAVRVLDLDTGALRWEAPTDRFTAAPAVHAGRVVLAIGDGDRHAPRRSPRSRHRRGAVADTGAGVVRGGDRARRRRPRGGGGRPLRRRHRARPRNRTAPLAARPRRRAGRHPGRPLPASGRPHVVRGRPPRARPSRRPCGAAAGSRPARRAPRGDRALSSRRGGAACWWPCASTNGASSCERWSEPPGVGGSRSVLSPEGPKGWPATLDADPSHLAAPVELPEIRDHARPHSEVVRGNPAAGGRRNNRGADRARRPPVGAARPLHERKDHCG